MDPTPDYYSQNARHFFDSTAFVDMSELHEAFLSRLAANAHILDAGCGSGRDAKAFADRGYRVRAFDASPELVSLARQHSGVAVDVRTFADVVEVDAYDGIWCCASLLHVAFCTRPTTASASPTIWSRYCLASRGLSRQPTSGPSSRPAASWLTCI